MSFTPHTPEEIREMLAAIGVGSIGELFRPIPEELRARSFDLPPGISEFEMMALLQEMAAQNGRVVPFVGGGYYDHVIPAAVDHLAGRSEFYTAYTPYQPEVSQGALQALFEYQSAICGLTGLEASNASLYDGGTALAEAAMMALRITGRDRVILDGAINPFHREIVRTYLANLPVEIVELPPVDGMPDRQSLDGKLDGRCAAVMVTEPDLFRLRDRLQRPCGPGAQERRRRRRDGDQRARRHVTERHLRSALQQQRRRPEPREPSLLRRTGLRLYRSKKKYIRNMPGRIVGETVDREGRRGFVLTLQAREQHIKRHKATSNICSNQSLCALRGLIFLVSLGKRGLVELARLNRDKAEYAKRALGAVRGVTIPFNGPTFNEFSIRLPKRADDVVASLLHRGIAAGVPLGSYYPGEENSLVVTVTEKRTRGEIDLLARELGGAL